MMIETDAASRPPSNESTPRRIQDAPVVRLLLLGFLGLVLQVPIEMIRGVISERSETQRGALREVTRTWGEAQTLGGPVLVVPYLERWRGKDGTEQAVTRHAFFLPEQLSVQGNVQTERRYRGIFSVPLYRAVLQVTGQFRQPDFGAWPIRPDDILWEGAELVLGISDLGAIKDQVELSWNGQPLRLEPGRGAATFLPAGVHLPGVPIHPKSAAAGSVHAFSFRLTLGGSDHIHFLPAARDTSVELSSSWPDPSFGGAFLPADRQVGPAGFRARWRVPHLGRNYPQRWLNDEVTEGQVGGSAFGVSFVSPGDAYTATTRAVKYQILFVMLTFLVFYLFELFYRLRIHPVQYLLVGAALCLFYLLLLALGEHLGFARAYLIAANAVVAVITGYCASVLRRRRLVLVVTGVLALLYGVLYVLLQLQDHALLVGSLALFAVLAMVMYVTRNVDWYRVGAASPSAL